MNSDNYNNDNKILAFYDSDNNITIMIIIFYLFSSPSYAAAIPYLPSIIAVS